jgi:prophage regulatory protein
MAVVIQKELLKRSEVLALLGISKSTLERYQRAGTFPPPLMLGPKSPRWRWAEIKAFIDAPLPQE